MKKKKEIWGRIFIGFVLLVIIFLWLIIMGIFDNFFEPHFKIYEEKCVDNYETLTDIITYTVIIQKEGEWGDYWKAYKIFEEKHKDKNFSSITPIKADIANEERVCKKIPILGTNDYGTACDYLNITVSFFISGTFYNGSQSCELVKVDEIEIKKEVEECIQDIDIVLEKCGDNLRCIKNFNYGYDCKVEFNETGSKIFKIYKISKKDLTIEWLDDNCECENYCDNPDFKEFNCKDNPCFLWKYEDYIIKRVR